jgi:DNA-binding CsgD family transcriptional regulator
VSTNGSLAPPTPETRRERQLMAQVEGLLRDAREQLGAELKAPPADDVSLAMAGSVASRIAWTALSCIEALNPRQWVRGRALVALCRQALELEDEVRHHVAARRAKRYEEMQRSLGRLRRIGTSAELLDQVCEELVRSCGFSRAVLTRIEGDEWLPWMAYVRDDREFEREFVEWMNQQRFPLEALGRERGSLRPVLVRDALADAGTFMPIIAFSKTESYVAAPVSPAGRVVGLLYADRYPSDTPLDEIDRDVLWMFTEDFSRIYERIVLVERMRAQRGLVREAFEFAENIVTALTSADIELARTADGRVPSGDEPTLESPQAPAEVDELLTAREKEVLEMMVRGASNAAIAERLVIREGTVKSHVKHILRKLGAVNRAEAISRYMGVVSR